jgi:hypothetical protein
MPPEHVMDLVDEAARQLEVLAGAGRVRQREEVAHRECVGPEVAPRWSRGRQARPLGERDHQLGRECVVDHAWRLA